MLTSTGNSDIFISKLDASCNFVWIKKIEGENVAAETKNEGQRIQAR